MMMMRAILLSLALALPVAAGPAAAHPADPPKREQVVLVEQEVTAFRATVKQAVEAKDVEALRRIYADSFTHTHGSGKMDAKDARIVAMIAADPAIETAPADELSFRVFGTDTVIVTGRSPILNKAENKPYDFRWMTVYVRAGGHWHIAASQATRLPVVTN